MAVRIIEGHFPSDDSEAAEELALAEIDARGWYGITLDFSTTDEELHWHDFASVIYVLSGRFHALEADEDRWYTAGPGTSVEATAGVVHREQDSHFRGVIGIDRPFDQLTNPLNKPLPDLVND